MFSIEAFHGQYETDETQVAVNGHSIRLLVPRTIDAFIDPEDPTRDFPLWAKVWEASLVLADFLTRQPPNPAHHTLEIGCGLGLVGIAGAVSGHRITSTEFNADALAFARANAHINGCTRLAIVCLNWHRCDLAGKFDRIVGSEVVYRQEDVRPLLKLFQDLLAPGGEIILASTIKKTGRIFLDEMNQHFSIGVQKKTLRSEDTVKDILLYRMTAGTRR